MCRHREKTVTYMPRKEALEEPKSANTLISEPAALWEDKFSLFKPPALGLCFGSSSCTLSPCLGRADLTAFFLCTARCSLVLPLPSGLWEEPELICVAVCLRKDGPAADCVTGVGSLLCGQTFWLRTSPVSPIGCVLGQARGFLFVSVSSLEKWK